MLIPHKVNHRGEEPGDPRTLWYISGIFSRVEAAGRRRYQSFHGSHRIFLVANHKF